MSGLVVKYGGSVLKDADSYRAAAQYQLRRRSPIAVVSAMNGVTEFLMKAYDAADFERAQSLFNVYSEITASFPERVRKRTDSIMKKERTALLTYLRIGARDAFIGSAEGHSAILFCYQNRTLGGNAVYTEGPNAGFFLDRHGWVDMETSRQSLRQLGKQSAKKTIVVGGYLGWASAPEKTEKTPHYKVGARNINDAFAVAAGAESGAEAVEIVKDVPAVYRVPPKYGDYEVLRKLSYAEAGRMFWRGSPVVHPQAIEIAEDKNMPIIVKDLESDGTVISAESETTPERFVAALVPETTQTVTILDPLIGTREGMDYPAMISQFGKEDETVMVTPPLSDMGWISYRAISDKKSDEDNERSFREHVEGLGDYLHSKGYKPTIHQGKVGVITIVGDRMQGRAGVFSYLAGILGKKGISMRSIVHGDEKYTPPGISIVVDKDNLEPSVKALAEELFAEVKT